MGKRSVSINDIKTPEERGKLALGWITGMSLEKVDMAKIYLYLQNHYFDGNRDLRYDRVEPIQEVKKEEEEEKKMDTNQYHLSEAYIQRDYLLRALRGANYQHERDSNNKFGLNDEDDPETGTEMVKRIKDGQYVIQKYDPEDPDSRDYIRWRDPAKVTDRAGHRTWMKKVKDLYEIAEAKIMTLSAAEGLAALNEFKTAAPQ